MIIRKNANNNKKELTIRDLRIGSIVKLHLMNDSRGDHGIVNCEIIALFNSYGSEFYKLGGSQFAVVNDGDVWTCKVSHIIEFVEY